MIAPPVAALRPFLPAKDFALSKRFYAALGFQLLHDGEIAIYSCRGSGEFILQDYYAAAWAENCMVQLVVPDLAGWWAHIAELDLAARFGVQAPRPPTLQPWGLNVAYVFDPCGVLWHVSELRPDAEPDRP